MLLSYQDVIDAANMPVIWYTREGYPRFCKFEPKETGVYVKYAILVEIHCQSCHQSFLIGEGYNRENWNALMRGDEEHFMNDLNKIVKHYHYGDPPRHNCPGAGETMNCNDIRFVEVWEMQYDTEKRTMDNGKEFTVIVSPMEWVRRTDLEKPCEYWVDNLEDNNG